MRFCYRVWHLPIGNKFSYLSILKLFDKLPIPKFFVFEKRKDKTYLLLYAFKPLFPQRFLQKTGRTEKTKAKTANKKGGIDLVPLSLSFEGIFANITLSIDGYFETY